MEVITLTMKSIKATLSDVHSGMSNEDIDKQCGTGWAEGFVHGLSHAGVITHKQLDKLVEWIVARGMIRT